MFKKIGVMAFVIIVSGCATSSKTYGPDGREAFSIDCSGLGGTWGACLTKAGDLCGAKGYDLLTSAGDKGLVAVADPNQAFMSSTISRNLLVSCKR